MEQLTEEERWQIVFTHRRTNNVDRTARECGVSQDAVRRWWGRYKETGGVAPKSSAGRKPAMSVAAGHRAAQMLSSQQYNGASHVAVELHK